MKRYRLADARRERDWSQERAAREIYNLGIKLGYRERDLGVDTRMVSGWERGAHHPKPHYVRILCKLYQLPEELLDLAPDVQEADAGSQDHVKNGTEDDPLQRRVFVTGAVGSLVGMTGLSDLARALTDSDAPAKAVTEHDCARHLAWGMWQSGRRSIHASELPSRIAQYLDKTAVGISESGLIVRDEAGYYSFAHESLLDFFVAQRIFAGIASGDGELLTTAQTTHNTDLVIRQFVSRYKPSANLLASWMNAGQSAVLRVNSAGILAKLNSAQTADEVIVALKRDVDARALYLTAVLSRVLRLSWDDAATLLANMKDDGKRVPDLWKPSDLAEVVDRFCVEAFNTRDAVARWLSISLLSRMREFAPENIAATFDRALDQETSRENLRAIASALSGHEPDPL